MQVHVSAIILFPSHFRFPCFLGVSIPLDGTFCFFNWQISHKYSLLYVITKLGLLFVYDLETATAVYRNRISPDPIFLTSEASSVGGFYAINRRGQVLLATVNEATIVPFVSGQVCCISSPLYIRGKLKKSLRISRLSGFLLMICNGCMSVKQSGACSKSRQKRKPSWCREFGRCFYVLFFEW